jgi:hypothetical protein
MFIGLGGNLEVGQSFGGRHQPGGADRRAAMSSGFSTVSIIVSYLLLARSMTIPGL